MALPLERYHQDLENTDFTSDAAQEKAVRYTQQLYDELLKNLNKSHGHFKILRDKLLGNKKNLVRGLYFWGGVGRGKTYLLDNFYECLPFPQKLRLHFHHFMQQVHEEFNRLKNLQNPLTIVAKRLAERARVICLDEFYVADITDAMLLSNLLDALFQQGVTLVITSNVEPDNLYKGGLQRERFLPAIALLKRHTHVVKVDNGVDYRLRVLEKANIYHCPLDEETHRKLLESFEHIAPHAGKAGVVLTINDRPIPTVRCTEGVAWFEFAVLCNSPRAVSDYIELAHCFNTVFISNVPQLDDSHHQEAALRFIHLVDEFYDRNVKLVISAQVPIIELYKGRKHLFPFQRTVSRLQEMCSHCYLERPHLP